MFCSKFNCAVRKYRSIVFGGMATIMVRLVVKSDNFKSDFDEEGNNEGTGDDSEKRKKDGSSRSYDDGICMCCFLRMAWSVGSPFAGSSTLVFHVCVLHV